MSVISYVLYAKLLIAILPGKVATVTAIAIGVAIYAVSLLILKVLKDEEIRSIPKGEKILGLLRKLKIY